MTVPIIEFTPKATEPLAFTFFPFGGTDYQEWRTDGTYVLTFERSNGIQSSALLTKSVSLQSETVSLKPPGTNTTKVYTGLYVLRVEITPSETQVAGLSGSAAVLRFNRSGGASDEVATFKVRVTYGV